MSISDDPLLRGYHNRHDPFSMRRRAVMTCLGSALAVALLPSCSKESPEFKSVDITGADYAKDFSLVDHQGNKRSIRDFKGKVVTLFFGFTQCPEVCPTTMAEMAQVKKLLGADGDKLQVLFVTVDPDRDTPAIMKEYMGNFDPGFLALVPTNAQLEATAKDFKIYYKKVEGNTSYTMDHTAGTYIFDTQGRIRLFSRYGSGAESVASDIRMLLKSA
jgi:protein SCO1/2